MHNQTLSFSQIWQCSPKDRQSNLWISGNC